MENMSNSDISCGSQKLRDLLSSTKMPHDLREQPEKSKYGSKSSEEKDEFHIRPYDLSVKKTIPNNVWQKPKRNRSRPSRNAVTSSMNSFQNVIDDKKFVQIKSYNHISGSSIMNMEYGTNRSPLKYTKFSDDFGKPNGRVPMAYDANMSLLKLAYKLKIAREKLASKNKYSIHKGVPNNKSISNGKNSSHCNLQGGSMQQQPSYVNTVKTITKIEDVIEIKPLKLPKNPKQAVNLLTLLKLGDEEEEDCFPDFKNVPLWPVLAATREGASRMDTSFLDKYVVEPNINNSDGSKITRSGRQVITPGRLIEKIHEEEHEDEMMNTEDVTSLVSIPEPLAMAECESVEKLGVSTIIKNYWPKLVKKAFDLTKQTLDVSKRAVAQSVVVHKRKVVTTIPQKEVHTPLINNPSCNESNPAIELFAEDLKGVENITSDRPIRPYTVSLLKPHIPSQGTSAFSMLKDSKSKSPAREEKTSLPPNSKVVLVVKDINTDSNTLELDMTDFDTHGNNPINMVNLENRSFKNEFKIQPSQDVWGNANKPGMSSPRSMPRKYRCLQCTYQTDNRSHLRRHESSVHSGDKMYCCYVCKKEFARSEKCKSHIIKTHPEVGYDPRFIRKDRFQGRQQGISSPQKGSPNVLDTSSLTSSPCVTPVKLEMNGTPMEESFISIGADIKETSSLDGSELNTSNLNKGLTLIPPEENSNSNVLPNALYSNSELNESLPRLHDSPLRVYRCQICFYEGRDAWHLKRHVSDVHNNKKAFKCRKCSYVTSRKHRLISHMKGHGELYCMFCEYSTKDYNLFQAHLKECSIQQRVGSLTCVLCSQSFFNRKIFADHMDRFHNQELYCCELCYYTAVDLDEFEVHEQNHFKIDCSATCNICKVSFDNDKQCEEHILQFHNGRDMRGITFNETSVKKDLHGIYNCLLCGFQSQHDAVMKNHLEMHTRNMHVCEVLTCSFKAYTKKQMAIHHKAEHPDCKKVERRSPERKPVGKVVVPQVNVISPISGTYMTGTSTALDKTADENIYDHDSGGLSGHGSGMWRCSYCPANPPFRYRRSFEKHMTKHFSNVASNVAAEMAHDIGEMMQMQHHQQQQLLEHPPQNNHNLTQRRVNENQQPEPCPMCHEEFPSRSHLRVHLQEVHETEIVEGSDDNLEVEDARQDKWRVNDDEEEGMRRTQMWLNEQRFNLEGGAYLEEEEMQVEEEEEEEGVIPTEWMQS